jgi:bacteriorhodopsin
MVNLNIYSTLVLSITIQIITGIIDFMSLFLKISSKILIIKQLIVLELIVQVIEVSFYIFWLYNFNNITNVTPNRYFDWMITTPTMLITLMFYLTYLHYKENNISEQLEFFDLFYKNFNTIIYVVILNWFMLLFGYLAEIKLIPLLLGVSLGFIPFLLYYYIIYINYALLTDDGFMIFFYFLFVWSLYGVAAIFPYKLKNMCYNILDLFAKNFFGLFLAYVLITNKD